MSKQSGAQNISHAQGASSSRKEFTTNVRPELSRVFTDYSRLFDPDSSGRTITLPEINIWMLAANIIDGRKISEQDTKEVFSLFRKDSLNFAQFNEFLDNLARETGANSDTFRMNLISCGAPKYESSVVS